MFIPYNCMVMPYKMLMVKKLPGEIYGIYAGKYIK
jgi:hypothetical protein